MADTEKNAKGTEYRESVDDSLTGQRKATQHDPWGRREVSPDDPNFVGGRPQPTAGEPGVVSAELLAEEDPDNPGVAKVAEISESDAEASRKATEAKG